MTDYVALLKENDLKATFQRINILDLIDKHGHMAVEDKPCIEETDKVFHALTDSEGFVLHKRQVNLYGVCASCLEAVAS